MTNPTAEIAKEYTKQTRWHPQQVRLQSPLSRLEAAALHNIHINVTADHSHHKEDSAAIKQGVWHSANPSTGSGTLSSTLNCNEHFLNRPRHHTGKDQDCNSKVGQRPQAPETIGTR